VNWADLMVAQGAFGNDFYDRSILRPKHRAYYCSGRPVMKIGPKGALGSIEIRPIHSAPSLGQSIPNLIFPKIFVTCKKSWQLTRQSFSFRKLWILVPPESTNQMKPTRVPYEESSIYSEIDFFTPSLDIVGK